MNGPTTRTSEALANVAGLLEPFARSRTDAQLRRNAPTAAPQLRRLEVDDPLIGGAHALLAECEVAERFTSPDELSVWLGGPMRAAWVAAVDGEVCAAAAAHHLGDEEAEELNARWSALGAPQIAAGDGYLSAAATAARWRRRGLHRQVVHIRLEWFAALGTDTVHTVAWRRPRGESHATLVRLGFVDVSSVDGYWDGYDDTATLMRWSSHRVS